MPQPAQARTARTSRGPRRVGACQQSAPTFRFARGCAGSPAARERRRTRRAAPRVRRQASQSRLLCRSSVNRNPVSIARFSTTLGQQSGLPHSSSRRFDRPSRMTSSRPNARRVRNRLTRMLRCSGRGPLCAGFHVVAERDRRIARARDRLGHVREVIGTVAVILVRDRERARRRSRPARSSSRFRCSPAAGSPSAGTR